VRNTITRCNLPAAASVNSLLAPPLPLASPDIRAAALHSPDAGLNRPGTAQPFPHTPHPRTLYSSHPSLKGFSDILAKRLPNAPANSSCSPPQSEGARRLETSPCPGQGEPRSSAPPRQPSSAAAFPRTAAQPGDPSSPSRAAEPATALIWTAATGQGAAADQERQTQVSAELSAWHVEAGSQNTQRQQNIPTLDSGEVLAKHVLPSLKP